MDDEKQKFVERLLRVLEDYPKSREALARELNVGKTTAWSWTRQKDPTDMRFSELYKIGQKFNLNMNWLFFGDGSMRRNQDFCLVLDESKAKELPASRAVIYTERSDDDVMAQVTLMETAYSTMRRLGRDKEEARRAMRAALLRDAKADECTTLAYVINALTKRLAENGADEEALAEAVFDILQVEKEDT